MLTEVRDVWDLVRLDRFDVTDFRFVGPAAAGENPQFLLQLDGPLSRRYVAVARLGDWPDVNLVWQLAKERLEGAVEIVRVPEYPEQRGLRFWYAKGTARLETPVSSTSSPMKGASAYDAGHRD